MSVLSNVTTAMSSALSSLTGGNAEKNEGERMAALHTCQLLIAELQSPFDSLIDISFATYKYAAVRTAIDMGLFTALAVANGASLTAEELSKKKGADALLITRIARVLVAMRLLDETASNAYKLRPLGAIYAGGSPLIDAVVHLGGHHEATIKLPEYLASINYANPNDAFHSPWQHGMKTDLHYFEWLKNHPKLQTAFNNTMAQQRLGNREEWFDFYPVAEKLRVEQQDQVVVVDVGGGKGHDLIKFHEKYPELQGKLIVQDLPAVIDDISEPLPVGIEAQKYDFFTPQPVAGAKAYYLRTVLHDWPDKQAHEILKNIREAMTEDSVLLINEGCIPEEGASLFETELDMSMMVIFASLERTEVQWNKLLEDAGFKITGMYRSKILSRGSITLFEAVVAK